MGREFKNQAVTKAYDNEGHFIIEEILPLETFDSEGSELLTQQQKRIEKSIRLITTRTFDENGHNRVNWRFKYDSKGANIPDIE